MHVSSTELQLVACLINNIRLDSTAESAGAGFVSVDVLCDVQPQHQSNTGTNETPTVITNSPTRRRHYNSPVSADRKLSADWLAVFAHF